MRNLAQPPNLLQTNDELRAHLVDRLRSGVWWLFVTASQSVTAGDPTGISGPPSFETIAAQIMNDPTASPEAKLFAAQMMKDRTNPWVAGVGALEPLGRTLLEAKLTRQFLGLAHPSQPNTQQPGPLQFQGTRVANRDGGAD